MGDLELRYAHLSPPDSPARRRQRADLKAYAARIWAEQEALNALMPPTVIGLGLGLPLAPRYRRGPEQARLDAQDEQDEVRTLPAGQRTPGAAGSRTGAARGAGKAAQSPRWRRLIPGRAELAFVGPVIPRGQAIPVTE